MPGSESGFYVLCTHSFTYILHPFTSILWYLSIEANESLLIGSVTEVREGPLKLMLCELRADEKEPDTE
jgi:hypothetical protein